MSWDNKVLWSEGMYLRVQHFQQQDRYVENLLRSRVSAARPYFWGFSDLRLDRDLLTSGRIAILQARGVLPDGTPFVIPEDVEPPPPLDVPLGLRNGIVCLAVVLRRPGAAEAVARVTPDRVLRYYGQEFEARDTNGEAAGITPIRVGKLRLLLLPETEDLSSYSRLGLARVVERRSDGQVVLDDGYVPPALGCGAAPVLSGFLKELQGVLHQRGEALSARVGGGEGGGNISQLLQLQVINRLEPLFAQYAGLADLHPLDFYLDAVAAAGELCTFIDSGRPPAFPLYRHEDLEGTFRPVMAALRAALSGVIDQNVIQIPLLLKPFNIRLADVQDRSLFTSAFFVIKARADINSETMRRSFPASLKAGSVEKIATLVNSALTGIPVMPLPVAPRQLRHEAGASYFELDRNSEFWRELPKAGGLAFHLSGDFPGLTMELWAIRT